MNFREQLSEAYKAGFNQGLQELYAGVHEGAHEEDEGYHEGMKRGLMAGYHEAMKEMGHEEDEGYHEGAHEMDEKALAELGRMMIRAGMHEMDHEEDEGYHEGMHEGEHEEQLDVVPLFNRDASGAPINPNVQAPLGFSRRRNPGSGRR